MNTAHLRWCISGLALVAGCSNDSSGGPVPSGVAVSIEPSLAFYPVASQISLTATVTDGGGTQIPDAKVVWTSDPADLATPAADPGAFTLNKVGKVTFTACTVDNASDGKPACGRAMIEVSPGAP